MDEQGTQRFVLFPIREPVLYQFYKKAVASFWTVEEVDLTQDVKQWPSLTDNERYFIECVLSFFAASDGIVGENLAVNFYGEVQLAEARAFYGMQIAVEGIHNEMYSLMIDALVKDTERRKMLFDAVTTSPAIKRKADWCMKWFDKRVPFIDRLVAFAAVEGIFFSSSFCAIFWLKKRGLMPGLATSNEFIARDEGLHCDFACEMHKLERQKIHCIKGKHHSTFNIIAEAVQCEMYFVDEALPIALIGMNAASMRQYVKFCANRLLQALDSDVFYHDEKGYKIANPFDWMEMISLQGKTNFFEKRVSEYAKANSMTTPEQRLFSLDEEF